MFINEFWILTLSTLKQTLFRVSANNIFDSGMAEDDPDKKTEQK